MKLLLLSNSTNYGETYLSYCKQNIVDFLNQFDVKNPLFIPFAAVGFSYDDYLKKVNDGLDNKFNIKGIHQFENKKEAVLKCDAIIVGGGNTFHLLHQLYEFNLLDTIKQKVNDGTPYIGWSAGSNIASPGIKTTNDMPIVEPHSFAAFNFVPFQINPHYLDIKIEGHNGETREQRILEFLEVNKNTTVVGLREGTMLKCIGEKLSLIGGKTMRVFRYAQPTVELTSNDDLSFLIH